MLVVTNQRGVASGTMSLDDVHGVNNALSARLRRFGARVDRFYVCPHANGSCSCRKPAPGLLFQASHDHPGLRLERTVMIGDSESDVEAASAAGACAIRLGPEGTRSAASHIYRDLSLGRRERLLVQIDERPRLAALLGSCNGPGFLNIRLIAFSLDKDPQFSRGTLNSAPNGMSC